MKLLGWLDLEYAIWINDLFINEKLKDGVRSSIV